jgi:type II secretory pathway pseudopilin PulG
VQATEDVAINVFTIMISKCSNSKSSGRAERGYILLTLLLIVALLVIAAGVMAPIIAFQMKRDREEELIHRGVQYSRAMKHFVKKFGRYPTRLEELENTNQVRFLRRRYKDPITGKDFKILRQGDVQLAFGGGLAGATPANGLNGGAPGGPGALNGAGNPLGQLGGIGAGGGLNGGGLNSGGPNSGGLNGGGLNSGGLNGGGANPGGLDPGNSVPGPKGAPSQNSTQEPEENAGEGTPAGSNPSSGQSGAPAAGPGAPGAFGAVGAGGNSAQGQVFGGGPMVGVASISHDKSIRVFNKKDHYDQWQFIYDPNSDRGGLLTTPNQPGLMGTGTSNAVQTGAGGTPGSPGAPGTSSAPGGTPGQPASGTPQGPGMQPPQMPPDQTEQ